MQTPRLGLGLAALTMGAVASVGIATPALAQTAVYPPTTPPPAASGPSISDGTPVAGQTVAASTGAGTFDAGSEVSYKTSYGVSGTVTANAAGAAVVNLTIPKGLAPGSYSITFSGVLDGQATTESVSFKIAAGSVAAAPVSSSGSGEGALPRTGSQEAVPIAAAGIALVAAGAGMVVVARRRRSELDGSIA